MVPDVESRKPKPGWPKHLTSHVTELTEGTVLQNGKRYVAVRSAGVLDELRVRGYEDFAGRSYDVTPGAAPHTGR